MQSQTNIIILVDVIGALSDQTLLNGNLAMMDNSIYQSTGQGTPNLCTVCRPGQILQWVLHPVDVQTPVGIKSITFGGSGPDLGTDVTEPTDTPLPDGGSSPDGVALPDSVTQSLEVWSGVVPPYMIPGMEYPYRLELQMYEGPYSVMLIDSCSLKCI